MFESNPRGFWWSIPATFVSSLMPRRFWTRLQPQSRPDARRIILYWFALAAILLVSWVALSVLSFFSGIFDPYGYAPWGSVRNGWNITDTAIARYNLASPEQRAVLDASVGGTGWIRFQEQQRRVYLRDGVARASGLRGGWGGITWPLVLITLSWGWSVLVVMQIFRRTLRQARIDTGHVLRASIYAADASLLVFLVPVVAVFAPRGGWFDNWPYTGRVIAVELWMVLPVVLFSGWRLLRAYTNYLRLPHALATVAAVEIMLGLAAILFLLYVRFALGG